MRNLGARIAALSPPKRRLLGERLAMRGEAEPIAIIGIGCRFPRADGPEAFWRLLRDGGDAVTEVPAERWDVDALHVPVSDVPGRTTTRWGGFLERVDLFDYRFFGISRREANRIDPQQRLLLEVAWEALEDAGQAPERLAGTRAGVFIGISHDDYGRLQLADRDRVDVHTPTGVLLSMAANRLSYCLDLKGPSMAVDTACSSSLVAVHLACQSLRTGESSMALAGGANVVLLPDGAIAFSKMGLLAADGRCKAFDARADGVVRGEGVGVVVLKPLIRALDDGDPVHAIIRGSAIGSDGRSNGLAAPNRHAQEEVLRDAYLRAGVSPGHVQYVEAHAMGTVLGDGIEAAALGAVLGVGRPPGRSCAIGSVKTNIGHLEAAAGIAGLIKVVLSLQNRTIPPSLHFHQPNPNIPFDHLRLEVRAKLGAWPGEPGPALAAVSSFGLGGTNAHVVLEEAPEAPRGREDAATAGPVLLPVSARAPEALASLARAYRDLIAAPAREGRAPLSDVCYTASVRRGHHDHRLAVVGRSPSDLVEGLEAFLRGEARAGTAAGVIDPGRRFKVAFVFSGQGAQWPGMGGGLLGGSDDFQAVLARCDELIRRDAGWSLLEELAAEEGRSRLAATEIAQPVVFALQVALAARWRAWGIVPDAVVGHGMGEVAAAHVAGVLTLEDALRIVVHRGRLMQRAAGRGKMAALGLSMEETERALASRADRPEIAAVNGPLETVVSGEAPVLDAFLESLARGGVAFRVLPGSYAFHSRQMESLAGELVQAIRDVRPHAGSVPFFSTVAGRCTGGEQLDAAYWGRNVRQPVWFAAAVDRLLEDGCNVLLEVGPHAVLSPSIAQSPQYRQRHGIVLPTLRRGEDECAVMLGSLGALYATGYPVDWGKVHPGGGRHARLPSYPWQRERCWLETDGAARAVAAPRERTRPPRVAGGVNRDAIVAAEPAARAGLLASFLGRQVADVLDRPAGELDARQSLTGLGLDSLMALDLGHRIETELGVAVPVARLLDGVSADELARDLVERMTVPSAAHEPVPGTTRESDDAQPLSAGQRALWFLHQLAPESAAYNLASAVRIRAEIDVGALRSALEALVDRHASLRATFPSVDGDPIQRISRRAVFCLEHREIAGWTDPSLTAHLAREARRPFDLERGPLLRVHLLSRAVDEHVLFVSVHHIVADLWSLAVFARELGALYRCAVSGSPSTLAPLPLRYTDYVRWQAALLGGPEGERHWAYWQEQLAGELPVLELPRARPRPVLETHRGATHDFHLPAEMAEELECLGRARGATLYTTLLTAFLVLLHRYTGREDLLVGSPTAGRARASLAGVVGYFVNPVVLRADLSADPTFAELLARVRRMVLDAFEHQDFPFPLLVERLRPVRDPSRSPLFQVMFGFQKADLEQEAGSASIALGQAGARLALEGLSVESIALERNATQFDLTLMVAEVAAGLAASFEYSVDLFDAPAMSRMAQHYRTLLQDVVRRPDGRLSEFTLVPEAERRRVLVEWNDTATDVPRDHCLHDLVERQVARTPDATAIVHEGTALTYRELDRRATQLADELRGLGVEPDVPVGVCVQRSTEAIVAILGILKAGGAYVPLDPECPAERLAAMLARTSPPVVLSQRPLLGGLPATGARIVLVDGDRGGHAPRSRVHPRAAVRPDDLAYVIFTSGSTGQPKGAMNLHRSISNCVLWWQNAYGLTGDDRVLHATPLSFDVSIWEIFWPLMAGATLVLASPGGHRDPRYLLDLIVREHVTTAHFVPSMLRLLLDENGLGRCTSLRRLICSGEALPVALQERFFAVQRAMLVNLYGPAEAAVNVTAWTCRRDDEAATVPIGRPIANTCVYVLDSRLEPVPVGLPGELCIGGMAVGRGYVGRPDLTAEKFVPDPFDSTPGARLYRTGDRARYRPDGSLEFLGRRDHQVKLRGMRVEPAEIEIVLSEHAAVREVVVTARDDASGGPYLAAYVVPEPGATLQIRELRAYLGTKLPQYMVPAAFVVLDALPLNPNGKVDRGALPAPRTAQPMPREDRVPPRTPLEETLVQVWAETLDCDGVGVHDDFFELGGDSLKAVRLISKVSAATNRDLSVKQVFLHPTVAALAEALASIPAAAEAIPAEEPARVDGAHGQSTRPFPTRETRPLLSLFAAGKLAPVQAAAVTYMPASFLGDTKVGRAEFVGDWCQGLPVVAGVLEVPLGRIALLMLPLLDSDLHRDDDAAVASIVDALHVAGRLGAAVASLTGLLPSATDYGRAVARAIAGQSGLPRVSTGHATTTAAVVLTVRRMLEEAGRDLAREDVAFLGLGSIGLASLRLLLGRLPHPTSLTLCDVPARCAALSDVRRELVEQCGFRGGIRILETRQAAAPEVYDATLIVGATNAAGVLDVRRLRPGTLVVDDSAPHCFDAGLARRRWEAEHDILFSEGGILRAPDVVSQLQYVPAGVETALLRRFTPPDAHEITACVLSSLLSSRLPALPPTLGVASARACVEHYAMLEQLGFGAARLQCEGYALAADSIRRFQRRFGGQGARPRGRRADGGAEPTRQQAKRRRGARSQAQA